MALPEQLAPDGKGLLGQIQGALLISRRFDFTWLPPALERQNPIKSASYWPPRQGWPCPECEKTARSANPYRAVQKSRTSCLRAGYSDSRAADYQLSLINSSRLIG
jgi:hypothetical protein